jgi:hypothetical protein
LAASDAGAEGMAGAGLDAFIPRFADDSVTPIGFEAWPESGNPHRSANERFSLFG